MMPLPRRQEDLACLPTRDHEEWWLSDSGRAVNNAKSGCPNVRPDQPRCSAVFGANHAPGRNMQVPMPASAWKVYVFSLQFPDDCRALQFASPVQLQTAGAE